MMLFFMNSVPVIIGNYELKFTALELNLVWVYECFKKAPISS